MRRFAVASGLAVGIALAALVPWAPGERASAQDGPGGGRGRLPVLRIVPHVVQRMAPRGQRYRLLRFRLRLDRVQLDLDELGRRESLADAMHRTRALLLVNAGFFDGNGRPIGLAIARGEERSAFSPGMQGGIVVVNRHRASLHATEGFVPPQRAEFAIQSKPRLVVDSQTVDISADRRTADRTGLCIRDSGRTLDVYVARSNHPRANGGPTLRLFARALQRAGCEQALNLDGGSSTGAAWREGRARVALPPRGAMRQIIVVRPASAAGPG